MSTTMVGNMLGVVDPRRDPHAADDDSRFGRNTIFTANAVGTTTTLVGANATPATGVNVVRPGDRFRLFTSAGVLKEDKVFTITTIAVAASTTVTFTPAAAAATASGDFAKQVSIDDYQDNDSLDRVLNSINSTIYSQANLDKMNLNDKIYALRLLADSTDRW